MRTVKNLLLFPIFQRILYLKQWLQDSDQYALNQISKCTVLFIVKFFFTFGSKSKKLFSFIRNSTQTAVKNIKNKRII